MTTNSSTRSKAAHGAGSVEEVRPGRSRITVMSNGKRRTFYCATAEVEVKRLELQLALKTDRPLPARRDVFLKSYATEWMQSQEDRLRPKSWKAYDSDVRNHIIPSLGSMRLADIRAIDVRRLLTESKARGLSPKSVQNVHRVLCLILDRAEGDELVDKNCARMKTASPPSAPRPKIPTPWTREEAQRFLDVVRGNEHETLYIMSLGLGLRRGEVCGLRWCDVDFPNRTISINGQLQRVRSKGPGKRKSRLEHVLPKTDSSIAVIDLPEFVAEALLVQRDVQKLRHHYADDGYVFTSTSGTRIEPDNITRRFPAFCKEHGLRRLRLHDLRHTAASLMLAKGVPLWQVSKVLRHSGIGITNDTYGHLFKETSREAAALMNDILSGALAP